MMPSRIASCVAAVLTGSVVAQAADRQPGPADTQIIESLDVAPVVAAYPVNFYLVTHGSTQYVAYYDEHRDMTFATRNLSDKAWKIAKVPSDQPSPFGDKATSTRTGWDTHNYITFDFDADGQIHLSGNLHGNPLLYFRTDRPGDVTSLRRIDRMTGDRESSVTYPRFIHGPTGELIFTYRDGGSGNGADYYNVYDAKSATWSRLLDTPLTDGRAPVNGKTAYAYMNGPTLGPDGYFHAAWVWRDTPDCATNHTVSYARSRDLRKWENSDGARLELPITPSTSDVVDPVPVRGGMINGNCRIGFDVQKHVIVSFHKYDANGKTQIYNARREADGWKVVQASRWTYRWNFSGGGAIPSWDVSLSPVAVAPDGRLVQTYSNPQDGVGGAVLDPKTLEPIAPYQSVPSLPASAWRVESDFPGMKVHLIPDANGAQPDGTTYFLRWETLDANRDRPVGGQLPEPGMLRVLKIAPARVSAESSRSSPTRAQ